MSFGIKQEKFKFQALPLTSPVTLASYFTYPSLTIYIIGFIIVLPQKVVVKTQ